MNNKNALLLIGSPKGFKSTSNSLGTYLLDRLNERDFATEKLHIHRLIKSDKGKEDLLLAVNASDIIILAFPLYIDSLPASVIKAMEFIATRRRTMTNLKKPKFIAISNNGFPEASQNDVALDICRIFAKESDFEWVGGLACGGGGSIDGRPLEDIGGMVRNVKKALELTAAAIADRSSVPKEAVDLMAKPLVPSWLYRWFANYGWKRQAKKHGVRNRINDQPYRKSITP
ncbi:MAG: hypothetical protein ACFFCD_11815 [Promethearchaeota archaeon]